MKQRDGDSRHELDVCWRLNSTRAKMWATDPETEETAGPAMKMTHTVAKVTHWASSVPPQNVGHKKAQEVIHSKIGREKS